jgi:ubiquitin-activating enzyme E1
VLKLKLGYILVSLPNPVDLAGFQLNPGAFNKDRYNNMRFVPVCSNLRVLNYQIPTADLHCLRSITGRIIPTMATTMTLVAGLLCPEIHKLVGTPEQEMKINDYNNAFVNLAATFVTLNKPLPPVSMVAVVKGKEWVWTVWDSLDMDMGGIILWEFLRYFETEQGLDVPVVSTGVSILFSFTVNKNKLVQRMGIRMSEDVTSVAKQDLPPRQLCLVLEIIANNLEMDADMELPYVDFRFC